RLQATRTFVHCDHTGTFIFAFDPALENIDHLKLDIVEVALGNFRGIAGRNHFDHMRPHHASGRPGDSEVTILRVASQSLLERVVPVMRGDEGLSVRPLFVLGASSRCTAAPRPFGSRAAAAANYARFVRSPLSFRRML